MRTTEKYNLSVTKPLLTKEWHPTKNGTLTPRDVTPMSNKKVWWLCKSGHQWEALIRNRSKGRGCPYCSGKRASKDNCLQTMNPNLAKQWHPIKNGNLTVKDVTPGSGKKAWWACKHGHEWTAVISSRNTGISCPYCSRRLRTRVSNPNSYRSLQNMRDRERPFVNLHG